MITSRRIHLLSQLKCLEKPELQIELFINYFFIIIITIFFVCVVIFVHPKKHLLKPIIFLPFFSNNEIIMFVLSAIGIASTINDVT